MIQGFRATACALASLAAAPAFAQDGTLTIAGKAHVVPAPGGYCSAGKAVEDYLAKQRTINSASSPDIVMMPCGATAVGLDFYAVKLAPDASPMERADLLAEMRRTMPAAQASGMVSGKDAGAIEERMGRALDAKVAFDSGLRPIDVDDVCAYAAGVLRFTVEGRGTVITTAVTCATVVNRRVVYLMRYLPGTDVDRAIATMPEMKAMALSVRPAR